MKNKHNFNKYFKQHFLPISKKKLKSTLTILLAITISIFIIINLDNLYNISLLTIIILDYFRKHHPAIFYSIILIIIMFIIIYLIYKDYQDWKKINNIHEKNSNQEIYHKEKS